MRETADLNDSTESLFTVFRETADLNDSTESLFTVFRRRLK